MSQSHSAGPSERAPVTSRASTPSIGSQSGDQDTKQASRKSASEPVEGVANYGAVPSLAKDTEVDAGAKERKWYHPWVVLNYLLGNWFLIGIGISIVLAWRFPNVASEGGDIRPEWSITYGAISLIFLITGLTLSTPALVRQLRNWRLHLFTQGFCFLFFPAIVFAIVNCVRVSSTTTIDKYVLAGMVVMSVMPTTVASNISMTRSAGGSTEAATMEVVVGNTIGVFITPLLCKLFFSSNVWSYGAPIAKGGLEGAAGLKELYRQLAKQLGLTLFVPLVVGQIILNIFPRQTKWVATTFYLPKVSTFLLLLQIWASFSNQFKHRAFETISASSVIFLVFVNLGLYTIFTGLCLYITRLPLLGEKFNIGMVPMDDERRMLGTTVEYGVEEEKRMPRWRRVVSAMRFDKKEATAICFCAAAKGMAVGAPTLSVLYGGFPQREKAILSIPLVLYQGQQVAVAQFLVYFFHKWNQTPDRLANIRKKREEPQKTTPHEQEVAHDAEVGQGGSIGMGPEVVPPTSGKARDVRA
ncbi:hypothetical protein IAT38_000906 [Cryptococcus sp. DSM 104549]